MWPNALRGGCLQLRGPSNSSCTIQGARQECLRSKLLRRSHQTSALFQWLQAFLQCCRYVMWQRSTMLGSTMQARCNLAVLEPESCLERKQEQKGIHRQRQTHPYRDRGYQPIFCWRVGSSSQNAPRTHGSVLDGNLGQRHGCSQSYPHCLMRQPIPTKLGAFDGIEVVGSLIWFASLFIASKVVQG